MRLLRWLWRLVMGEIGEPDPAPARSAGAASRRPASGRGRADARSDSRAGARSGSRARARTAAPAAPSKAPRARLRAHPPLSAARLAEARATLGPIEGHELSDEQISAIAGAGHTTLVLAGAGTGKTTVINGYVTWLLAAGRAQAGRILVLSYTRASADEMAARIRTQTGQRVHACTFHSLGLEICRASTAAELTVVDAAALDRAVSAAFRDRIAADEDYRRRVLALMPPQVRAGWRALLDDGAHDDGTVPPAPGDAVARACRQHADRLLADARTIIQHMRANQLDMAAMRRLNAKRPHASRAAGPTSRAAGRNADLLDVIEPLHDAYMRALADANGVDFAGMIADAVAAVRAGRYVHGFTHVLIDEYQDLSRPRYELVRALREQSDFDLFAVGDDWQSIYRFAGSDIRLILDFADVWRDWGPSRMFRLTVTRRFRASLIEASGRFVMADRRLFTKRLTSDRTGTEHSIRALGGLTDADRLAAVAAQLGKLPRKASVLMLGRYAADLDALLRADRDGLFTPAPPAHAPSPASSRARRLAFRDRPDLSIEFMTVHASKGLQRDFTFLLSCSGGVKGFPSGVPDEPLLGLILPEAEAFPDAEERRLMYVAMTRCVKKLFLVVDRTRPSRFMYELRDLCPGAFRGVALPERCPQCGEALTVRQSGGARFHGCTGWPSCRFTRPIG